MSNPDVRWRQRLQSFRKAFLCRFTQFEKEEEL